MTSALLSLYGTEVDESYLPPSDRKKDEADDQNESDDEKDGD